MQETLDAIRNMCIKFPTQEKILIIPAFRMKGQILKYLNDSDINAVNLKVMSAGSIAMEWAEADVLSSGAKVLSYNDVTDIIGEVTSSLKDSKSLAFFENSLITPGLSRTISSGIIELKKNGIKEGKLDLDKLPNHKKRNDLMLILSEYEKTLKDKNYLDQADVIEIALRNIKSGKVTCSACYILPGARLAYMEKEMLEHLWPNSEKLLKDNIADGLKDNMAQMDFKGKEIKFVKAYGEYNEAKEVVRNIVINKLPLDATLVAVTTTEPYAQLFYQLFQEYIQNAGNSNQRTELPITFGTGLPVTFSNPGKLALAILKWIKFGYRAHDLISIFASGAVNLNIKSTTDHKADTEEEQTVNRQTLISIIKNSNLKWQRQTYHKTFEDHKKYLHRKIEEAKDGELDQQRHKTRLDTLIWLDELIENNFFANIPSVDEAGKINADQLYRGVGTIIGKCKRINDKLDSGGYDALLNEMKGSLKSENIPVAEAVDILVDRIKQIRTFVENPAPGKLHIASYKSAAYVNRENVFVIGLHAGCFPGLAIEDPILLDEERLAISKEWLITSEEVIEDNIKQMNDFINSVKGKMVFSYPYFDTVDNRGQYPATLYSEILEEVKERLTEEKEKTVEFLVSSYEFAIDENDYWLRLAICEGAQGEGAILNGLRPIHPELYAIHKSASGNNKATGMVDVSRPELIDPRKNNRIQSASVLSEYLSCKYRYLLKNVLFLKEFKEKELDIIGWLDALESGSLFHEILEEFHNQGIKQPQILEDVGKAKLLITKIAESTINRYEEDLPTASSFYTDKKKEDILIDCLIFAEEEVENHKRYKPFLTEYRFGFDGKLELNLGDGENIRIMGAIDRIDRISNQDALRIVDYKTGGDGSYSILDDGAADPLNHKTMQPALYYMAMKKLAKTDDSLGGLDKVKEAIYYFVSRKGDYKQRKIEFDKDSEDVFKQGLNHIFNQMADGIFNQSEIEENPSKKKHGKAAFDESYLCKYCGYKEICEQSFEGSEIEVLEAVEENEV